VTAFAVTTNDVTVTNAVTTAYLYADSILPTSGQTIYINSDAGYIGSGGGNSTTHIGDLAGDNNNTFITVDDAAGNITVSAPNGTVSIIGGLSAAGATFNGPIRGSTIYLTGDLIVTGRIVTSTGVFGATANALIEPIDNMILDGGEF
jgi:hypothetical protein